jgi:GT2 family glycosyltransferase
MLLIKLNLFMQNNPLVSVVIPTYNRKKILDRLLSSILKSTYKKMEIIIIDDASSDGTYEFIQKKYKNNKSIKIFRNKKNMFAAGSKNEGLRRAKGEYIAFIDDDNVVDKKMFDEFVKVFLDKEDAGELGPINYNYNSKNSILLTQSTRNMWTTKTNQLRTLRPFKNLKIWEADDVPNAFIVRGEVIRKNKITFDRKYGIMYEESDFAYSIREKGYKVYMVREAKIYHDIEDLSSKKKHKDYVYHFMEDPRRPFTFARNRIVFHKKYSTKIQNVFILSFWIWFFAAYYSYKFIFYKGFGDFSLSDRAKVTYNYIRGTFDGVKLALK